MELHYFSRSLDNGSALFIAPLSDFDIEASGETVEDATGYFLYQRFYNDSAMPLAVLARLHSEEAALEMRQLLDMS